MHRSKIGLSLLLLSLLATTVAHASLARESALPPQSKTLVHSGYSTPLLDSAYLRNPVTLDGQISSASEWSETTATDLTLLKWGSGPQSVESRWWVKNDAQWLYLLCRIEWPANEVDVHDGGQIDYFWPTGSCCPWDHSDLGYAGFGGSSADLHGWDESSWSNDTDAGGNNDVEGSGTHDGTHYWFEFRKRLDSGDGVDWSFRPGQTVGTGYGGSMLVSLWDNSEPTWWETEVAIQLGAMPQGPVAYLPAIRRAFTAPQAAADTIYHHGALLTMEGQNWEAQAIAIRGQLIQAVGSDAQVLTLRGPSTEVIDLQGRCLMPGFVDPHNHVFNDSHYLDMDWEEAQSFALQHGITTMANMYCDEGFVRDMQQFERNGLLKIRTSMYLLYTDVCGVPQGDWWKAYRPTRGFGEMLRVGGLKIFSDGGVCGCPAYGFDDPTCGFGDLWLTQTEMNIAVAAAQSEGYQMAIHSLGDRSLVQVLNAYEHVLDNEANTLRHRVEHNSVVPDDQLTRYSDLDLVATLFGAYPCQTSLVHPEAYRPWKWRWSDLLSANPGVHFAWHSDTPWVGPPANPLAHLYSLVTDHEIDADGVTICDTPFWLSQKKLTVRQALPMMTTEAAYALFRETEVGSLAPGKLADLVVLSASPTAADPEDIKDIEVLVTMVGGTAEYCASGHEGLCPGR